MIDARDNLAGAVNEQGALLQTIAESLRIALGELTLSLADIAKWSAIPAEKRRTDWDLMPLRERRKVRKVAA